ncbi:MAG: hypothetical protein WC619_01800 [Patescibacteria group bacterium]
MAYKPLFSQPTNTAVIAPPKKGGYIPLFAQPTQPVKKTTGYVPLFAGKENKPVVEPATKTSTLPDFLGGGAYNTTIGQPNKLINTGRSDYGGEAAQAGMQRDDIVPVSLGGINDNIKNIKLTNLKNAKKIDELEKQMARDFKAGKISLPESRLKVLTAKQKMADEEKGIKQGVMANLPKAIPEAIEQVSKEIGQSIIRSFFNIGQAIYDRNLKATFKPETELQKKLVGEEPTNLERGGREFANIVGLGNKIPQNIAIGLGMVSAGLDIVPIGGGTKQELKQISQNISKSKNEVNILRNLKKVFKGDDELLKPLAKDFVNITDPKIVENNIKLFQKGIKKPIQQIPKKVEEENITKIPGFGEINYNKATFKPYPDEILTKEIKPVEVLRAEAKGLPELPKIAPIAKGEVKLINDFQSAIAEVEKLKRIPKGMPINEAKKTFEVTTLPEDIVNNLKLENSKVTITRQALKHVVEYENRSMENLVKSIPDILTNPTKIADNSAKRPNSYLFAKMNGKARGVVLEVTKTPDGNQVVSAFPISRHTYDELVDISGRAAVPPSVPGKPGVPASLSGVRDTTNIKIAQPKKIVNTEMFQREQDLIKREMQAGAKPVYQGELENQYQSFKQAVRKTYGSYSEFLNKAEDLDGLKTMASKKGISGTTIDNLTYSQEKKGDEVFSMFKDRIANKVEYRGVRTQLRAERLALNKELRDQTIAERIAGRKREDYARGEFMGYKEGYRESKRDLLERISIKAKRYAAVRDYFNLTDQEIRKITQRNPRYMSDKEFEDFMVLAKERGETKTIRKEELSAIKEKTGVNLPASIKNIDVADLNEEQFKKLTEDIKERATEILSLKSKEKFLRDTHGAIMEKTADLGINIQGENWKMIRKKFGVKEANNATLNQWKAINVELDKMKADFEMTKKKDITAITFITEDEYKILKELYPDKSDKELITTKFRTRNNIGFVLPTMERGEVHAPLLDFTGWHDSSTFGMARETISRNLDAVAGPDSGKVKNFIVDFKRNRETGRIKWKNNLKSQYKREAEKLKIKPWSKDDTYVQMYGEERLMEETVKERIIEIMKKNKVYSKTYEEGIVGNLINKLKSKISGEGIIAKAKSGEGKLKPNRSDLHTLTSMELQGADTGNIIKRIPKWAQNRINNAVKEAQKLSTEMNDLIMSYGPDNVEIELLKRLTLNWENIAKLSDYFKKAYDGHLGTVNFVRKKFEYEPIQKHKLYFRHFRDRAKLFDIEGFDAMLGKENLPTGIFGETEFFRPGKPFNTTQLQRRGEKTTFSSLGGMDDYLDTISKEIFHTETLQRIRALENYIRKSDFELSGKLSGKVKSNASFGVLKLQNFVSNLKEYGNQIAYKKLAFGRAMENNLLGRTTYTFLNWLGRRTSLNMVIGSVSSALTNFIPFTTHFASINKKAALAGLKETLASPFTKSGATIINGMESKFLYRRHMEREKLAPKFGDKGTEIVGWLFFNIDKFTSKSIVAGKYYDNLLSGMNKFDALREADNYAIRQMADRGYGEMPNLFSDPGLKELARFQLEVNNIYSFIAKDMKDIAKKQQKSYLFKLIQFSIYTYLFNVAYKTVTGRNVNVDPIRYAQTIIGVGDEYDNTEFKDRLALAAKEIGADLPFSNLFLEGRYMPAISSLVPKSLTPKEITKPLFYLASPIGGGGQIKKTVEGLSAYFKGGVDSASGKTQLFEIEKSLANFFRTGLFGKWSTPEARDYFNGGDNKKINSVFPGLPALPKLPQLPALPKLPKL